MSRPKKPASPPPAEVQKGLVPIGGDYFPSVKKARAALMSRAHEIFEKYMKLIDMAAAAGDFETANKAMIFLIEHMPKEDGESVISESAAKPKMVEGGPRGPIIQIGVKVGGSYKDALPEPITIDVEPNS